MMQKLPIALLLLPAFFSTVSAECANGCNGHGKCTSYDMCICNRNWQASDCSERVCQFGLAHVDTPKGDLDMSGDISDADTPVIENSFNYPYGTTEMFPAMQDTDLGIQQQSAHYYMECSNKGTCDRGTGECNCFDGFDGASCQRASCPNSCSGHGVCKTIEALAKSDGDNLYKLWDRQSTMGCECDAGYFGSDCSQRECKHGIDPLYFDDSSTVKYSIYNFVVAATDHASNAVSASSEALSTVFHDGTLPHTTKTGEWAIRFYDVHGEDWLTQPIKAGAECYEVVEALGALPNNVISMDSTICTRAVSDGSGDFPEETEVDFFGEVADKQRKFTFKSSFWETTLPQSFAQAMKAKHSKGFASSTEEGFPSSYSGTNVYTPIKVVGYIYRIKFFGNPGKLREPEIEIYLDGKRPSILTQKNYHMITRVYTDGQQGESDDYFADHCDGVTAYVNRGGLDAGNSGAYLYNSYHYLGLSNSEIALLKACLGGSDDDDTNNIETYNWDWGNQIFPHLVKLVRSTTVYTDGGYYVALVWKNTGTHKECSGCVDQTGAFVLVNPFKSLDADGSHTSGFWYGTDLYDIYTTKGTLALTTARTKSQTFSSQAYQTAHHYGKTEAIFGFGSKEIIMTRPLHKDRTANTNDLGDLQVNAGSDSENTGSVSCEHLTNADNYYCLNKTDIFTLLTFDDGTTPSSEFDNSAPYGAVYSDVHFMANPPYLNLYSAEKLVSDRADYSVKDLFLTTVDGNDYSASTIAASTGLNRITTDISTNWAASLISATNYVVGTGTLCTIPTNTKTLTCPGATSTLSTTPQVGDFVSSAALNGETPPLKGVYITKITSVWNSTSSPEVDGEYELSDAVDVTTAETFSFYRHPQFQIYKFTPAPASTYKYVGECANRGTCDRATGLCNCFAGYSSDACQTQNSLAV